LVNPVDSAIAMQMARLTIPNAIRPVLRLENINPVKKKIVNRMVVAIHGPLLPVNINAVSCISNAAKRGDTRSLGRGMDEVALFTVK